jgi:hypothetical protein
MKTLLFIPAYQECLKDRNYKLLIKAIIARGYKVDFVSIAWERSTMDDWLKEFNKKYKKYNPEEVVLAGFSFGANIAFIASANVNPSELWLFSLSPYFAEDAPGWKKSDQAVLGHRRITAFKGYSFNKLAEYINCKTKIFLGSAEAKKYSDVDARSRAAGELIKSSELFIVPGAGHDATDPAYIEAVTKEI